MKNLYLSFTILLVCSIARSQTIAVIDNENINAVTTSASVSNTSSTGLIRGSGVFFDNTSNPEQYRTNGWGATNIADAENAEEYLESNHYC